MAQILRFTSNPIMTRDLLIELKLAAQAAGMTWEACTKIFCTKGRTWDDYPDDALRSLINLCLAHIEEERQRVSKAAPAVRRATVIPFDRKGQGKTGTPAETSLPVLTKDDGTIWVTQPDGSLFGPIHLMADGSYWFHNGDNTFTVRNIDHAGVPQICQVKARACRNGSPHAQDYTVYLRRQAKETQAVKAKTQKQATQPDDKELAAKANYIRRIKMLQRDCEKALHRFDDDAYRAILAEQFHATTSKALSLPQLRALLMHMKGLLQESRTPIKASFDAPALLHHDASGLSRCGSMRKIQALLAEKGKAEGKYIRWSYALGILKRQTKGVTADWEDATPHQLDAVIAALSKDAQRKRRRTQ